MSRFWCAIAAAFAIVSAPAQCFCADGVAEQIQTIRRVAIEGGGHADAVRALAFLNDAPASALVPLLAAMDDANPLAENWLRGAFESIADRSLRKGGLAAADLERFALDRSHAAGPRSLAFDWLTRVNLGAADRLTPGMIDDPSPEFRRLAVARLIDAAAAASEAQNAAQSKDLYNQAFRAALDPDQLDRSFDELTKLGETPDLLAQLGLINRWRLIGPFDHRGGIGFDAVYPPEQEIDLEKTYAGQTGDLAWVEKQSDHRHALVDLNKLIAPHKGAVMYAYCNFESERDQPVEFRLGTPNGWKLWVNGELAFAHEEYHQSSRLDQYRASARLRAGSNDILLKICQNEMSQDWAQRWEFALRVVDPTGTAVNSSATHAAANADASLR
jgi:hypothetical protein